MWAELAPIGRDPTSGGYLRFAWTPAERTARAWFRTEAARRELVLESDGNGNDVAWWRPEAQARAGGVVTGSHLDSVPHGGAFDGPLGVVSGLAAIDVLRGRGLAPVRPVGVAVFAEEEGGRFGTACLGSRLLTGLLTPERAAGLRAADGVGLVAAMASAGDEPDLGRSGLLDEVTAYVELHIEQGRGLVDLDAPVGVGAEIWPHGRWLVDITGRPDHAGTTRLEDRSDPMLTAAATVLCARTTAEQTGAVATVGRILVEPNGTNAIPSRVRAWLDARAPDQSTLTHLIDRLTEHTVARAGADGTSVRVVAESASPAVSFAGTTTDTVRRVLPDAPVLPTAAGHDAGVLAEAGIPTAMLFVRNPTGVSHSPAEHATEADCLAGVEALAAVLEELAFR
jgi:N-carbamoyl-L-amino-acid hydrolase